MMLKNIIKKMIRTKKFVSTGCIFCTVSILSTIVKELELVSNSDLSLYISNKASLIPAPLLLLYLLILSEI